MTDLLRDLVGRTLGVPDVVRPRPGAAFEPDRLALTGRPIEAAEIEAVDGDREQQVATAVRSRPRASSQAPSLPPTAPTAHAEPTIRPSAGERSPSTATADGTMAERGAEDPVRPRPTRDLPEEAPTPRTRAAQPPRPRPHRAVRPEPAATGQAREAPRERERTGVAEHSQLVEPRTAERQHDAPRRPAELATSSHGRRRERSNDAGVRRSEREDVEPVVHVHIDRIEVRAPAAPEPARAPRPREPTVSLDDYLAQTRRTDA